MLCFTRANRFSTHRSGTQTDVAFRCHELYRLLDCFSPDVLFYKTLDNVACLGKLVLVKVSCVALTSTETYPKHIETFILFEERLAP